MKLVFAVLVAVVLGAVLWGARDTAFVRQFMQPVVGTAPAIRFDNDTTALPPAGDSTPARQDIRSGMRKCLRGAEVLYTDAPCPAGSREAKVAGGAVTVLPGTPATTVLRPPKAAASAPNVRDLLLPPGEANLRDRQMEKVVGK
jgi:hypothetical protein